MNPDRYNRYLLKESNLLAESASLPSSWDWRDFNAVTPAKDQGWCGSCWAFTATGALESHIILDFGESYDLSEQALVSCAGPPVHNGCCGGGLDSIRFYETRSPREESCFPYMEAKFGSFHEDCPPTSLGSCYNNCDPVCYNVTGFYTMDARNSEQVKRSIFRDGPCLVAFMVYEDFDTYWDSPLGTPPWVDGVYYHASGDETTSHGVLAFGWDDTTSSYYLKNSWGESGPFGDGTFRMRADHIFEAVNFRVIPGTCDGYRVRLSAPVRRTDAWDNPCAESSKNVRIFHKVDTPFPDRIAGGTWFTMGPLSDDVKTVTEPIPNADYLRWDRKKGDLVKDICVPLERIGDGVKLEYWMVDSEGVESEHQSFTLTVSGIGP
jgi:hypothetical protein